MKDLIPAIAFILGIIIFLNAKIDDDKTENFDSITGKTIFEKPIILDNGLTKCCRFLDNKNYEKSFFSYDNCDYCITVY
ncbi:hypothetical protein CMO90_04035 [Candidatus Woesearchaeota archaeon]|jgi:hypothetical protein|nr:hypothetical protein [Candidatus Woesearchaeota archaeon]|tara:strand:- start:189 stop:425 length:237 start_codon:yes stop_codon:yes gene_type:complete